MRGAAVGPFEQRRIDGAGQAEFSSYLFERGYDSFGDVHALQIT